MISSQNPLSPREVVLRVKAILRRCSQTSHLQTKVPAKDIIVLPHLTIDNEAHRVIADDKEVELSRKEYELLLFLAKTRYSVRLGTVVKRSMGL